MKRNLIFALLLLIIVSFVLVSCDDDSTLSQQPMDDADRAVIDRIFVDIEVDIKRSLYGEEIDLEKAQDEYDDMWYICKFDMGSKSGPFFAHALVSGEQGRITLNNFVIQNVESNFIYTLTGSFTVFDLCRSPTDYSEKILFTEEGDSLKIVVNSGSVTKEINLSKLNDTTEKTNIGEVEGLLEPQAKEIISGLCDAFEEYRDLEFKKGVTLESENIVRVAKELYSDSSKVKKEYEEHVRLKLPVVVNGDRYTIELKFKSLDEEKTIPGAESSATTYHYMENTFDFNVTMNGRDTIKGSITVIDNGSYPSSLRRTLTVNSMEINGKKLFADEAYGYLLKKVQYLKAALDAFILI